MIVWVSSANWPKVIYHTLDRRLRWNETRCRRRTYDVEDHIQHGTFINVDLLNPDRARPCKRCWPDE